MNHKFTPIQETADGTQYYKCLLCNKIMFKSGDDYFNLVCQAKVNERENLRQDLEKK